MSLVRPIADSPSGSQGNISQPFAGTYFWEPAGYVKFDAPVDRGARRKFATDAKYLAHIHLAIDYICAEGTAVRAMKGGTIIAQGRDSTGALFVYHRLRVGTDFEVVAMYYHLSRFLHPIGALVARGATVALSGNTGWSTGPHLHLELIRVRKGTPVGQIFSTGLRLDPQPFIDGQLTLRRVAP